MPRIELSGITKRWDKVYAVDNLNLVVEDNAFVTLLGPSGCGKTTTLRMIAGLETPTKGRITIGEKILFDSELGINVPANKRKVGFLFQNYALWPNMTIYQNIAFGLSNIKEEKPIIDDNAKIYSALISILKKPAEVIKIINECKTQSEQPNQPFTQQNKKDALLKLIDHYEISMNSAKTLLGYNLHESIDPHVIANARITELETKLQAIIDNYSTEGITLNEKFELVKDGRIQKAVRKLSSEEIDLIVRRVSRIVKVSTFMDRYPNELSGGQQQRVAIARTLAPEPSVLFMDEPLSNLDAKLRLEMRTELQRLHIDTGSTFIYVTHEQMEAMTLSTRICLMNNGVLQQYDTPLNIYNKPVNLFVADFVGNPSINFIEAKGTQKSKSNISLTIFNSIVARFKPNQNIELSEEENDFILGVRPETVKPSKNGIIEGEIYSAMPTGMETTIKIKIAETLITAVVFGGVFYKIGEKIKINFEGNGLLLFSRKNEKLIALGSVELE